jgi:hypothetical protein
MEDVPKTFEGNHEPSLGERVTGVRDPKDPDGLITLEQWRKLHPGSFEPTEHDESSR